MMSTIVKPEGFNDSDYPQLPLSGGKILLETKQEVINYTARCILDKYMPTGQDIRANELALWGKKIRKIILKKGTPSGINLVSFQNGQVTIKAGIKLNKITREVTITINSLIQELFPTLEHFELVNKINKINQKSGTK